MTKRPYNRKPFFCRRDKDGSYEKFDIVSSTNGNIVTSISEQEMAGWAVLDARQLTAALNMLHAKRGRIDIRTVLAEHREIALIWSVEDVQRARPNLDEDQAWQVLQQCERDHDRGIGFNWHIIESVAGEMFPDDAEGALP